MEIGRGEKHEDNDCVVQYQRLAHPFWQRMSKEEEVKEINPSVSVDVLCKVTALLSVEDCWNGGSRSEGFGSRELYR